MSNTSYQLQGELIGKYPTEQITDKFSKREFVVKTTTINGNKEFNEEIKFQCVNDKCSLLDNLSKGQQVNVSFNIRGRRYEKNGKVNFFNNLDAWRVDPAEQANPAPQAAPKQAAMPQSNEFEDDGDSLPF